MKKWYTCTPISFHGDHTFFYRDSGLFSRAFSASGCESKAVMPLPARKGDWPELIRTEYSNLENAAWWKSQEIDGVLLYAWGAAKYERIARAIHESDTKLVIYLDTSFGFYPFYDWKAQTELFWSKSGRFKGIIPFAEKIFKGNLLIPIFVEGRRKKHLLHADIITAPIPYTVKSLKKWNLFYKDSLIDKVKLLCNPVAEHFIYTGECKQEQIIAIGRWDDFIQKRPLFLQKTLQLALTKNHSVKCSILGSGCEQMIKWKEMLPAYISERITIERNIANTELPSLYKNSSVCLCSSEWEGTHIVSTEALCCGCSVVAPNKVGLEALQWYVTENSGTLSREDTPESLAEALLEELRQWGSGNRNPDEISRIWKKRLHATASVKRILQWDETGVMPGIDETLDHS